MKRASVWAVVCLGAVGCAAVAPDTGTVERNTRPRGAAGTEGPRALATPPADASPEGRMAHLASPPWAEPELPSGDVPEELVRAWRGADNRGWCAPLAPELVGGAPAREVSLDGGWAVAFDAPGRRGVLPDGHGCSRCGMSAFGIAGTAATAEDWGDLGPAQLEPGFRDGSLAEYRRGDTGAATATLVARGQHCVYQVWSFLGEEHLRDLIGGLRFVAVRDDDSTRRVAQAN
ncbi:MAG: hypothetical protein ACOCV4_09595 [Myxococcota bacterium]